MTTNLPLQFPVTRHRVCELWALLHDAHTRHGLLASALFRSDITECWLIAEVAISAAYVLLMTMIECDRAQRPAEQQALEAVAHLVVSTSCHNILF